MRLDFGMEGLLVIFVSFDADLAAGEKQRFLTRRIPFAHSRGRPSKAVGKWLAGYEKVDSRRLAFR